MTTKITDLLDEAERLTKRNKITGFFNPPQWGEAAEIYEKVANIYKCNKKFMEAIEYYIKARDFFKKNGDDYNACQCNINAAASAQHSSRPEKSIELLNLVIIYYTEKSDHHRMGDYYQKIAELYHGTNNTEKSIEYYKEAMDCYDMCSSTVSYTKCSENLADSLCKQNKYKDACDIYKNIFVKNLNNQYLKFQSRKYFIKCILCLLATGDIVASQKLFDEMTDLDYTLESYREYRFISTMITCVSEIDIFNFELECKSYDSLTPLDPWMISILCYIKEQMSQNDIDIC